jgi:hypothetical protein
LLSVGCGESLDDSLFEVGDAFALSDSVGEADELGPTVVATGR